MGRRGYVMTQQPEYGTCVSDWAQSSLCEFLTSRGLEVTAPGTDCVNVEDADHWEIQIPERQKGRGKKRKWFIDYARVLEIAAQLRRRPGYVKDTDGGVHGEHCAELLRQGVTAAKRQKLSTITIDWW